jgi:hypothetical protein
MTVRVTQTPAAINVTLNPEYSEFVVKLLEPTNERRFIAVDKHTLFPTCFAATFRTREE